MKTENMNNVQMMCKDCTEMRKKDWQDHNKATKIRVGDFVKVELKDGDLSEHCWIKINKVDKDGKTMHGTLDNIPIFVKNCSLGDYLFISRSEIEEHLSKKK